MSERPKRVKQCRTVQSERTVVCELREIPTRMLDLVRVSTIKIGYLTVFHQRKRNKERKRVKQSEQLRVVLVTDPSPVMAEVGTMEILETRTRVHRRKTKVS